MSPLSANVFKHIGITLALGVAFIVMASIFTPERTQARNQKRVSDGPRPRAVPARNPDTGEGAASAAVSADAHSGLRALGVIEDGRYTIGIFGTDAGPRYTIVDAQTQVELGTLLTPEQVEQLLPEVDLRGVDFSAPPDQQPLMLAEPRE